MIYSERKYTRLQVPAALPHLASVLLAGTVLALAAGCSTSRQTESSEVHAPAQEQNYNSPTYHGTLAPDDGQWTRPAKDLASTRYTTLNQITPENAQNLKVAFTFSLGTTRGAEAAPIVVNNTMYIVTPWPNYVYALDPTKPGAPLKWKFDPETSPASKGTACCDWVNRGGVYTDGEFIFNTLDGNTIALNADTGKPIWRNHVADIQRGETLTMAPLVVKDKVMVGNSGGEFGIRGWVKALDSKTGKLVWTGYTTGPDKDVLIGPRFHAFYQKDQGADLGVKTWPPGAWQHSGGGMWGWMSYDPKTNLLFHGTANPSPWNAEERPGDNKWTAGIFARDADTGEAVWAYQYNPHDLYDYDGINENVLLDLPINGQQRKVLVHPDRNGYMYILDRKTGEVLSAHPFGNITDSTGVDLNTGDIHYVPEKHPKFGSVVRDICPAAPGAKDWTPMAFSPRDADKNREYFEEQLQLMLACFNQEHVAFKGKYFTCPPEVEYRGYQLKDITMVPRPKHLPVEVWMPVASGKTIDMMAKYGLKAMVTLNGEKILDDVVRAYQAACAKHGQAEEAGAGHDAGEPGCISPAARRRRSGASSRRTTSATSGSRRSASCAMRTNRGGRGGRRARRRRSRHCATAWRKRRGSAARRGR